MSVSDFVQTVFGGDYPEPGSLTNGQVAARALVIYLLGLVIIRIGKSRMISRTTPLDVLLAFIFGSILGRGINGSGSLTGTASASLVLMIMHWLFTWAACKSHKLGDIIKGHTKLLVVDGEMQMKTMSESHISQHDLLEELRLHAGTEELPDVERAYKERSGDISVIKRKKPPQVVEIEVADGVQTVRIEVAQT